MQEWKKQEWKNQQQQKWVFFLEWCHLSNAVVYAATANVSASLNGRRKS